MKAGVHPKYYTDAVVTCACGNTFTVGSIKPKIDVEICAKCHPFFTGEMRFVDRMGRVERFQQKQQNVASGAVMSKKKKEQMKKAQLEAEERAKPKSLKEMFERVKASSN